MCVCACMLEKNNLLSILTSLSNFPCPCLTVNLAAAVHSDPSTYGMSRVQRSVCGNHAMRLQNLQLAVNCLKHFYLTTQQQLILVPLPDVTLIAHEPDGGEFV